MVRGVCEGSSEGGRGDIYSSEIRFFSIRFSQGAPMNDMARGDRKVVSGKVKMTPSEAFVETMVAQGVTDIFGIVGSAYMDALDIFPAAGIRFIPVAHEQGAVHMADGYSRVSGRHGVCIGQNGPRSEERRVGKECRARGSAR